MSATTEAAAKGADFGAMMARALIDIVAPLQERVERLEADVARLRDDRGPGAPATPPRTVPAPPAASPAHPDPSPGRPPVLPGQTSIDDQAGEPVGRRGRPMNLAAQGNRSLLVAYLRAQGGEASKRDITRESGIKTGSVVDAIANAVRDGALVDTGRRQKTRGPSSPIYALARPDTIPGRPDLELSPPRPADPAPARSQAPSPATVAARQRDAQAMSGRLRRQLERENRAVATAPAPKAGSVADRILQALDVGPRDPLQLAKLLNLPKDAVTRELLAMREAGAVVLDEGVARLT